MNIKVASGYAIYKPKNQFWSSLKKYNFEC